MDCPGRSRRIQCDGLGPLAAVIGLLPKTPKCRQAAKSEGKQHRPINWQQAEIDYNDKIREGVGTERPVDVAEIAQNAYHIFTDGSFTGHRNHRGRHKNPGASQQLATYTV